ncbi:hypothetical protein V9T40_011886 [Parthenolecanium corni]|uniref:Uncharacterized protein n=1 Tax=Parthenolecanium corni TaxID=536013 RepID=A0AAN9T6V0_9HEMI
MGSKIRVNTAKHQKPANPSASAAPSTSSPFALDSLRPPLLPNQELNPIPSENAHIMDNRHHRAAESAACLFDSIKGGRPPSTTRNHESAAYAAIHVKMAKAINEPFRVTALFAPKKVALGTPGDGGNDQVHRKCDISDDTASIYIVIGTVKLCRREEDVRSSSNMRMSKVWVPDGAATDKCTLGRGRTGKLRRCPSNQMSTWQLAEGV